MTNDIALTAYPMHGQHKLLNEGYRTRDGHLIEWFGDLLTGAGEVAVLSRPEPWALNLRQRMRGTEGIAANTRAVWSSSARIPNLRDRRRWWVDSLNSYSGFVGGQPTPVVTWNPFLSMSNAWDSIVDSGVPVHVDLLDDWSIHYAFDTVHDEVETAYRRLFAHASSVTANAEGTLALAHRFGRDDALLLPNGCDPERFSSVSAASGPLTVGYVGKIGKRLNLEAIVATIAALPDVSFVFAGPILDAEYRAPLQELPNVTLLGDVHYAKVPELLTSFDIGWVPHRVGTGEVGGDVIKTYEYRAAGLPVLTTPVEGATSRGLTDVYSLPADEHAAWIAERFAGGARVPRSAVPLPEAVTWEGKARRVLSSLSLSDAVRAAR